MPCASADARPILTNWSVAIGAAGMPRFSKIIPSCTLQELQEPQSPTAGTTTSHSRSISSSKPRTLSEFGLLLSRKPTRLPSRLSGRGARLARSAAGPAVGSRTTSPRTVVAIGLGLLLPLPVGESHRSPSPTGRGPGLSVPIYSHSKQTPTPLVTGSALAPPAQGGTTAEVPDVLPPATTTINSSGFVNQRSSWLSSFPVTGSVSHPARFAEATVRSARSATKPRRSRFDQPSLTNTFRCSGQITSK